MTQHVFVPTIVVGIGGQRRTVCETCGGTEAASAHVAAADVAPETDGAQRWQFIRGERP